jgi:hypothetical protein
MLSHNLIGTLLREPCSADDSDLKSIHTLPNPPLVKLMSDDIHIRQCRLASDRVDSRNGCFRTNDLTRLLELIQGAPVLIGHDKRTLGVARFFGGKVEQRESASWIIPRFYWPRAHSKSEDLRVMIDSGVYNEASIAFIYNTPTCSICGKDLRSCSHWPGREYDGQTCMFYYDGIERVTEGSLVYRGAAPGTGIELSDSEQSSPEENSTSENRFKKQIKIKHHGQQFIGYLQTKQSTI